MQISMVSMEFDFLEENIFPSIKSGWLLIDSPNMRISELRTIRAIAKLKVSSVKKELTVGSVK